MSNPLLVRYIGFQAKQFVREYTFRVQHATEEAREFTLTIRNEAFDAGRVRYQDAPDICSLMLHRELEAATTAPLKTHLRVSDVELEDYRTSHAHRVRRSLYTRKFGKPGQPSG
ncbi:MAG TPA: hypothetical protein VGS20_16980 [Candidatus Acidoferrales bacterium]|nr:hypothetical protein [Candidatus Acidoferrales bacterium]